MHYSGLGCIRLYLAVKNGVKKGYCPACGVGVRAAAPD